MDSAGYVGSGVSREDSFAPVFEIVGEGQAVLAKPEHAKFCMAQEDIPVYLVRAFTPDR